MYRVVSRNLLHNLYCVMLTFKVNIVLIVLTDYGIQIMVTPVTSALSDYNYSVVLSFERHPFSTYPIAYFNLLDVAFKWLMDIHVLLLREHILQICDSDFNVVFQLSYFLEFDEDLNKEKFVVNEQWISVPEDYYQADLPF